MNHAIVPRETAALPAPDSALTGDELLAAVTEAMVALDQRYHHRMRVTAKTLLLGDDLLACVLAGVYTDVEKTMIELQRSTIVQETDAFQNAMHYARPASVSIHGPSALLPAIRASPRRSSRRSPAATSGSPVVA